MTAVTMRVGQRLSPIALQRKYSFAFALALTVVLLVVNLTQSDNGFGWTSELANFAPLALAAMASTPAIMSGGGGFDVSISPLMTLSSVLFVAVLVPHGLGGAESVPILMAICTGVGLLSGFLVVTLRVPPVVVTLAMYFVLLGVGAKILPQSETVTDTWVRHLAGDIGPFPGALFTLLFPLLIWFLLGKVPFKKALYAVGGNDATAYASGVNIAAVRVAAYGLGGLFASVAGLSLVAITLTANADLGGSYTLLAIAAVALGGTSLWGGRGGLFGPLLGAACIYLLQDLLTTLNVAPSWLQGMYGGALVLAVVLSGLVAKPKVTS
jgi:ribose transport system permease protein